MMIIVLVQLFVNLLLQVVWTGTSLQTLLPVRFTRSSSSKFVIANPSCIFSRNYTAWNRHTNSEIPLSSLEIATKEESIEELSYHQVFERLCVRSPWQLPARVWRWCYYFHRWSLRLLHWNDPFVVPNSSLAGLILWWKAIVGNDRRSLAFDTGWAQDLLPPLSGWMVQFSLFRRFFPRLSHANIELRTVFLNDAVSRVIAVQQKAQMLLSNTTRRRNKVRLVVIGAGYDVRGTRLLTDGVIDEAIELDLPAVVDAKHVLWTQRLCKRRQNTAMQSPYFVAVDLNDIGRTRTLLEQVLHVNDAKINTDEWYTVYVAEGVFVHLRSESGKELLKSMSFFCQTQHASDRSACFVFADAIPYVQDRNLDQAISELAMCGWRLLEFQANPTRAPHFGIAIPASANCKQNF